MKNLEIKLDENDFLTENPVSRFMYFRAIGQEEKAKEIANSAFADVLSRQTQRKVVKDISQYSTLSEDEITNSLCLQAQNDPSELSLELAIEYGADIEKVEETLYCKFLRGVGITHQSGIKKFLKDYNWEMSKGKRRNLLSKQYSTSITTAHKKLSHYNLEEALCAMGCAELLEDDEAINESGKEIFRQNLWARSYNDAGEIAHKLNSEDIKSIATDLIKLNIKYDCYRDAEDIANRYVPELCEQIREVSQTLSSYVRNL
ncbi:MAG: hypothetical protein KJ674_00265 [Nanoarchaeota archaeon]|nr:hypothetical protein [Nanoarchaeota archaeon]